MSVAAKRSDGTGERLVLTFHAEGRKAGQLHDAARTFLPGAHVVSPAWEDAAGGEEIARAGAVMAAFARKEVARTGTRHVTGIGHSGGADMLMAAAIAEPGLFHAIALLHPTRPPSASVEPGIAMTRVLVTGGRADERAPPAITQAIADWFGSQKADVTLAWHPGAHEIPQSEVDALGDFLV